MKKLGVVNCILAGQTVAFAHGSQSAIDKKIMHGRQRVTQLGFINDQQGDPRFHGGIQKHCTFIQVSIIPFGNKS